MAQYENGIQNNGFLNRTQYVASQSICVSLEPHMVSATPSGTRFYGKCHTDEILVNHLFQKCRLAIARTILLWVSPAPTTFQRSMDSILQGLPQVLCYIDDILVGEKDNKDHLQNLALVPTRLEYQGIRLKKDKCKFMEASVEYLGHIIDKNGLHTSD